MKSYLEENSIRLIGKGWEIRHKLRQLSSDKPGEAALAARRGVGRTTLADYLKSMAPRSRDGR